jgi:hypothetical protein
MGWTGLQKLHAVEIIRKSCNAMGLGNSFAAIEYTAAYSNMTVSTSCSFLQFSGSWPHPVKAEKMCLMAFGNPELIPLLKNPGPIICSIFIHISVLILVTQSHFVRFGFVCGCQILVYTSTVLSMSHNHDKQSLY